MMVESYINGEVILIAKAIIIALLGVLFGFIGKHLIRRGIDVGILKKLFKEDVSTYDVAVLINKTFTEVLQWVIILGFFNYSLTILGFNFLTKVFEYIIADAPKIAGFIIIIAGGFLLARLVVSRIKEREIEHKNEITTLVEMIIIAAFILTALELIGVRATALIELYKVVLYIIGILIVLLIIKPDLFEKKSNKKKEKETIKSFLNF